MSPAFLPGRRESPPDVRCLSVGVNLNKERVLPERREERRAERAGCSSESISSQAGNVIRTIVLRFFWLGAVFESPGELPGPR